jgi:DNA-binding MarR family transcriptional regulator
MQDIINIWKAYVEGGGEQPATDLGIFFIKRAEQLDAMRNTSMAHSNHSFLPKEQSNDYSAISLESLAGILVGRVQRFVFMEAKPRLKEAGLDNVDDFGLLAALYFKPFISKGQLLKQSLIEPATGTEILKRMKKAGWVDEKPNPDDGRSWLVALTKEGRALTERCFFQLKNINNILYALSQQERIFLISILEKLDNCHSERLGIKTIGTWMMEGNKPDFQLDN